MKETTRITIVGGGISGLSLAYILRKKLDDAGKPAEITLIEKDNRFGGTVNTVAENGYILEGGPNGFLDNKPKTLELISQLAMGDRLQRSNDNARKRYIFSEGKLHNLPGSPKDFITSDLLSVVGRLRAAGEILTRRTSDPDETVSNFGKRHIGREAMEKMIDPFISGVFAGDPEKLSLRSIMPKMAEMDDKYGSLIKAMKAMQKIKKEKEKELGRALPSASPFGGGVLTSFSGGMGALTEALAQEQGIKFLKGTSVDNVDILQEGGRRQYRLQLSSAEQASSGKLSSDIGVSAAEAGQPVADSQRSTGAGGTAHISDILIFAIPAHVGKNVLADLSPAIAAALGRIAYSPATVVCYGYDKSKLKKDLDGFGFLIPHREKRRILGSVWASSVFPSRAPEGKVLMQTVVGGACDSKTPFLEDEALHEVVQYELSSILGIDVQPDHSRLFRYTQAIPQYNVGHGNILRNIDEALEKLPGLYLTGNAFLGVGVNDCIENSFKLADKVASTV